MNKTINEFSFLSSNHICSMPHHVIMHLNINGTSFWALLDIEMSVWIQNSREVQQSRVSHRGVTVSASLSLLSFPILSVYSH